MNKIRLLKLTEHLEKGKLGQGKFDILRFHEKNDKCGTLGCAIGELPHLFPREWYYEENSNKPLYKNMKRRFDLDPFENVMDFFAITRNECYALFTTDNQELINGISLDNLHSDATPKDVAKNIRKFIAFKEKI